MNFVLLPPPESADQKPLGVIQIEVGSRIDPTTNLPESILDVKIRALALRDDFKNTPWSVGQPETVPMGMTVIGVRVPIILPPGTRCIMATVQELTAAAAAARVNPAEPAERDEPDYDAPRPETPLENWQKNDEHNVP